MTIFKRRFGDYLLMAKTRCEWDTLKLLVTETPRIPGHITKNSERSLRFRSPTHQRQGNIRQNA